MTPGEGKQSDDDDREQVEGWIASLRRKAELTSNPLYVWHAILYCTMCEMPLPDWCIGYLGSVAFNLFDLAAGVDFREHPSRRDSESAADVANRTVAHFDTPTIEAERALELVPQALELSRQGKNAFTSLRSDEQKVHEAMRDMAGRVAPAWWVASPPRKNLDPRHALRRIAEGYRLSGMTKPKH
jgi:hypothetical protein